MGYKFWCERCGHNYYTVGGGTWYKSGTVTKYPSYGYCGCCGGKGRNPGWSWSGNVVKLECRGCSNIIGIVSWSDWKNRSGESTGFCSGCRDGWNNKKSEWERRKSAASSCKWASVGWDGWSNYDSLSNASFRFKCYNKGHSYSSSCHSSIMSYINQSQCARCVKEARSDFCPSEPSPPSHFQIDKEVNDELWKKCKIYCTKYNYHVLYEGTNHQQIVSHLNANECKECVKMEAEKKERDDEIKRLKAEADKLKKAKAKEQKDKEEKDKREKETFARAKNKATETMKEFKNKADKIKQEIKNMDHFNDNIESEIKLDEQCVVDLEQQIADGINSINAQKVEIQNVLNNCQGLSDEEKQRETVKSQQELDDILDKYQNQQDEIIKYKSKLKEHNKKLDKKKKKVIEEQQRIQKKILDEMKNKEKLDPLQQKIDDLQKAIHKIPGDQIKSNPEAIKTIKKAHNELIKSLKEKNKKNNLLNKELKECSKRLNKIRGLIAKSQSENIYLIQLLDEDYERLDGAIESAEMKYEENGVYFLSVTNGFDQDIVKLFVDAGYDQLDEIKGIDDEQELIDIGLIDPKQRKMVKRKLKIK